MPYGSAYYHRSHSNQEFTSYDHYQPRHSYPLPKCFSDSRYDKHDLGYNSRYERFASGQGRYGRGYRYRGGQEDNRNDCEARQLDPCSKTNDDNDVDCCNLGQDCSQSRTHKGSPFPRGQSRGGTYEDSCRQRDDVCDIYRRPKQRKPPKRKQHCIPKCCLDYNTGNDDPSCCCTCEPCPFCLLRSFCTEVLRELAEIKAKGGELEKLLYDPKAYQKQLASERMRYDEEEDELQKGPRALDEEFSSESARRRHSRSDENYSRDDNRSRRKRHSDDSMARGGRGKRGDRSFDDRKRDRKGKKSVMDGRGDGKTKGKETAKQEKKKDKEPVPTAQATPVDGANELDKASKKTERDKKKQDEDKAKKALIERRVQQSALMSTKHWTVKKFTGAGKFCDCQLGCSQEGGSAMEKPENTVRLVSSCLKLRSPISMPMIFTINPRYCCPSFWCPPPPPSECPAICG